MTLNDTSTSNKPTEPIAFGTKINKKKKFSTENLLGKAYSVLSENEDDLDVFGKFVTSELRGLQTEHLKKKAKRQIQRILLDIAEEDDSNIMSTTSIIPVPSTSLSSVNSNSSYNTMSTYNNNPDYNFIVNQAVTDIPNMPNSFHTDI
jgi:hypothetical protein